MSDCSHEVIRDVLAEVTESRTAGQVTVEHLSAATGERRLVCVVHSSVELQHNTFGSL